MKIQDRKDVIEFVRAKLSNKLAECTEPQRKKFVAIYGEVSAIRPPKLGHALDLVERTLRKNATGR